MKRKQNTIELIQKWNMTRQFAEIRGDQEFGLKALKYEINYLRRFLSELGLHKIIKIQLLLSNKRKEEVGGDKQ